jgi:hypothetical protein
MVPPDSLNPDNGDQEWRTYRRQILSHISELINEQKEFRRELRQLDNRVTLMHGKALGMAFGAGLLVSLASLLIQHFSK